MGCKGTKRRRKTAQLSVFLATFFGRGLLIWAKCRIFALTNYQNCPVFLTWGYNDIVCPPTTSYIVWNLITAPKESLMTPINEHWTTEATNYSQMLWLKKRLF